MKPAQIKNLKIGVGITAAVVAAVFLFRKTDSSGAMDDPTGNGSTIPGSGYNFNALTVATKLYNVLVKTGFAGAYVNSIDKAEVFSILTNVNEAQLQQVVSAFRELPYNSVLGDQTNLNPFVTLPRHNLVYWLNNEMDADGKAFLRLKFPNTF